MEIPLVCLGLDFAVGSQGTIVAALEVIDLLGESVDGFAYGRDAGSRHVERAGCLISHTNGCLTFRQKNGCHFPCRQTSISNPCRSIDIMWERQPYSLFISKLLHIFCMGIKKAH